MMYIPNQLIGAPVNTQVTMECTTEASPKVRDYVPLPSELTALLSLLVRNTAVNSRHYLSSQ